MAVKPKLAIDEKTENVKFAIKTMNKVSTWIINEYNLLFFNGDLWAKKHDAYEPVDIKKLKFWIKTDFDKLTPRQIDTLISNTSNMIDNDNMYTISSFKDKVFFTNGIYYLKSGEFEEIASDKLPFSPNVIPYDFVDWTQKKETDTYKKDHKIVNKLINIFGQKDKELMLYYLEVLGSAMSMRTPYAKFIVYYGDGETGKSTMIKFNTAIVGERNANSFSLKKLSNQYQSAGAMMSFYGKTFVFDADAAKVTLRDISDIKQLTGGDLVEGKLLYQNPTRFVNYSTIAIITNHMPKITEISHALNRRFDLFPLDTRIEKLKDNERLNEEEYEYAMTSTSLHQLTASLALQAWTKAIQRGKLTSPQKIKAMLQQFKSENNDIFRWLQEEGVIQDVKNSGMYMPSVMFQQFKTWTIKQGEETQYLPKGFTQALNAILKNDFNIDADKPKQKVVDGAKVRVYSIIDADENYKIKPS